MNIHSFLDHYAVILGALLAGRRKFFDRGVESLDFAELKLGVFNETK